MVRRRSRLTAARVILAIAATSSLVLAGCSMDGAKGVYGSGPDAIIRVNAGEPQSGLLPTDTNENMGGRVVDALFTGLYTYRADGTPELANAESVATTDNKHFVVKLKRDWTFTDGTPVKASNYVRAWNFGASIENLQKQQILFSPIAGYEAVSEKGATTNQMSGLKVVDDYTFTVDLTAPNIDFKLSLGFTPFKPLPDVFFVEGKEKFGQNPVSNGPYKFKQWRHNVQLDVVRNDDYKGPKPKNGGIAFIMYESYDSAYTDLLSNNLDALDTIPNSALRSFRKTLGDKAITQSSAQMLAFAIPEYLDHFKDDEEGRLRRQAISMSINRQQVIDVVFRGLRNPSLDFTARSVPGWDGNIPGNENVKYNPDKARQKWAQANAIRPWSGSFGIAYNSDGDHKQWIDAVAIQIKNTLKIDAEGKPYATFKQIRDELTKHTLKSAGRNGWQGDYPSLMNFLQSQYLTDGGSNDSGYSNPDFDAKMTQAQQAVDPAQSSRLVNEAQALLLRDLPAVPLWDYIAAAGVGDGIKGELGWSGLFDFPNLTKE
ncbi:peptide ABC transporter substrate-binding protein [Gordonia sp. CPCC 205333]|uniref:peptide ABC transporter substrate-binding protein n=1 Tax=Gordonia sp. CPCC 205333 TaxID=3140790 RepID=UPI003AF38F3E